jgi:hypothetical protein
LDVALSLPLFWYTTFTGRGRRGIVGVFSSRLGLDKRSIVKINVGGRRDPLGLSLLSAAPQLPVRGVSVFRDFVKPERDSTEIWRDLITKDE